MILLRTICAEIRHRRLNAVLLCLCVIVAVLIVWIITGRIATHDRATERVTAQMVDETKQRVDQLKDDYRKIALELGFNVFIVPDGVRPDQIHNAAFQQRDMPMDYAHRLARSNIVTVNHLLPSLSAQMFWPEQRKQIVLTGVRGELAQAGKKRGVPLIQPVGSGEIVLGYSLAQETGLAVGDRVEFMGHPLKIHRVHGARGTADDMTAWVDLELAQQLLNKPDRITAIHAINCLAPNCHPDETGIPSVSEEITRILPDTEVIIDMGKARTRISARQRAAEEAKAALEHEIRKRSEIRNHLVELRDWLLPVILSGAAVWIGLLMMLNVRDRQQEIAVFRALGLPTRRILVLLLGRAFVLSVVGTVAGAAIGVILVNIWHDGQIDVADSWLWIAVLVGMPLLALAASWLPVYTASQRDPARILAEE